MRKFAQAMAVVSVVALCIRAVNAQEPRPSFISGKQLWEICHTQKNAELCRAFVVGVIDGVNWNAGAAGGKRPYCYPKQTKMTRLQSVAVKWLEKHPNLRHQSAANLVVVALAETFPCPK